MVLLSFFLACAFAFLHLPPGSMIFYDLTVFFQQLYGNSTHQLDEHLSVLPLSQYGDRVDCPLELLSCFSCVRLCATPQMAAHQARLSLGSSRQEHWSGLPFPPPMHESEK